MAFLSTKHWIRVLVPLSHLYLQLLLSLLQFNYYLQLKPIYTIPWPKIILIENSTKLKSTSMTNFSGKVGTLRLVWNLSRALKVTVHDLCWFNFLTVKWQNMISTSILIIHQIKYFMKPIITNINITIDSVLMEVEHILGFHFLYFILRLIGNAGGIILFFFALHNT